MQLSHCKTVNGMDMSNACGEVMGTQYFQPFTGEISLLNPIITVD